MGVEIKLPGTTPRQLRLSIAVLSLAAISFFGMTASLSAFRTCPRPTAQQAISDQQVSPDPNQLSVLAYNLRLLPLNLLFLGPPYPLM